MHHSYSFNQSQYQKCFEDFHTMFHKSRPLVHLNLDLMHAHFLDWHFWPVCLHPYCTKCLHPYCTILAEWSSVEALLYCQTGTSHSQWVWICVDLYWVTPDIFLSSNELFWGDILEHLQYEAYLRSSSWFWGIVNNALRGWI